MDTLNRSYIGSSPSTARMTGKQILAGLLVFGVVVALATCGAPAAAPTSAPLTWTQKADMQPCARFGFATAVVDGKLYTLGGLGGEAMVQVYDPATDTWAQKASMLHETVFSSASVVDGRIYVIGGNPSDRGDSYAFVEEYDPVADTWTEKARLSTPRDELFTAVVGDKIYAMGGRQWEADRQTGKDVATVEVYDPATDTWTTRASLPTTRSLAATGTVDGKIYVLGGQTDPATGVLSSVLEYDPATDTWTEKCPMPARTAWGAATVHDGLIYVFGGSDSDQAPASSAVFVYDPATDTWAQGQDLPFERWGMSAELVGGTVYLIGGTAQPSPFQPCSPELWECDLSAAD